jgi:hypothetical protein
VAVGYLTTDLSPSNELFGGSLLVTTADGVTWQPSPLPGDVHLLSGVSCPSTTVCVAAGQNDFGAGELIGTSPSLAATSTTGTVAPTSVGAGHTVHFTATVSDDSPGSTPTGSVIFSTGDTALCQARLTDGHGSCPAANAPIGTDSVTATYSGDSTHLGSTGSATLVVRAASAAGTAG